MAGSRLHAAPLVVSVLTAASLSGCGSSGRLPAPVTFAGVGGVTPHMTLSQVRRTWGLRVQVVSPDGGSAAIGYAPICVGGMRGAARFIGLDRPETLLEVWFFAGARTDRGVGIGSTLAQLRRVYGSGLRRFARFSEPGYPAYVVVQPGPAPRTAILFLLQARSGGQQTVYALDFGYYGDIGGANYSPSVRTVTC